MTPFIETKVAFHTLGCKLNFAETSAISKKFKKDGYAVVDFDDEADIYVINTCSVTDHADNKCRYFINKSKRKNPESKVVIIGCYAQLKPDEIVEIPGVDMVLGAKEKFNILDHVEKLYSADKPLNISSEINEVDFFSPSWSVDDRTRTFLKIQDGCDYSCTFCTIPLARGKSRSSDIPGVLSEVDKIAKNGVKEIVLTGVNTGDFGRLPGEKKSDIGFLDLVKELNEVQEIERFRISSIEPNLLHDEIIKFVASSKKFVPHFHIPLQSGSNKILKLMRRRYLRELYQKRVETIHSSMNDCAIGVDVITGFPGETEADFLETYNFLLDLDIAYLHVFTYSERPNTPAIEMDNVVPFKIRKKRTKMLRSLSEKKRNAFYNRFLNTSRKVLWEGQSTEDGKMLGYTDNYIRVEQDFEEFKVNTIEEVYLSGISPNGYVQTEMSQLQTSRV
ncbi:MAG: tRNA (N(6)-L-threonylcarbamoyladenosine(37)-C(2))-methylthiotransferase MtaB [Chitinophagaceae bacterium]|nr:MAG: tRNA (N(6)-L-threonylcarbamoyladenosine(37)-C(2))-methylthiotransferase MtaB [Chitinophagaceae bacterium]